MKRANSQTQDFKHTDWLSLVELSGMFYSVAVLEKVFPQNLEAPETLKRQILRRAYEEWLEARENNDPQLEELHLAWVQMVLKDALDYEKPTLIAAKDLAEPFSYSDMDSGITIKADYVLRANPKQVPPLLIQIYPPETNLERVQTSQQWATSPYERTVLLCRATGIRLALITNGERWMLVNAPVGGISGYTAWYARLWWQEPITYRALISLLGVRRIFAPSDESLEAILDKSLENQEEVTDTLGSQVKSAVEVLIQALDREDRERNGELLATVKPSDLYEAGLTVMMRLVFIMCAEERQLLLLGEATYDRYYAVSSLRAQLEESDPEILKHRYDAWSRLLAIFRAIYGGIQHENLRLPALGGSLFDPDRFAFLEGRKAGSSWRDTEANPLPVDNRIVLMLLRALQVLEHKNGAQFLSYRALDVEQIGHVYEGLLEHTVARLPEITLGLVGSAKIRNPNIRLIELESAKLDGKSALLTLVQERTSRSDSAIQSALNKPIEDALFAKLVQACKNDSTLAERIKPFVHLLRVDNWGKPMIYPAKAFAVTLGNDRRETGTHYTPKSLTEQIVRTTLEPVVYIGPAEGTPREQWQLKTPAEILELKICDPAMGSGAFLVQTCRWLSERLVESWTHAENNGFRVDIEGETREQPTPELEPMPTDAEDRLMIARRLIAERCLYGVDINPLAVELAKLSIWLTTLAKNRPFGFLDHNLRTGDSLLGIHKLEQLYEVTMKPSGADSDQNLFARNIQAAVNEAIQIRQQMRSIPIRDIQDVERMARMDSEARQKLEKAERVADALVGETLRHANKPKDLDIALHVLASEAGAYFNGEQKSAKAVTQRAQEALSVDLSVGKSPRKPMHWPLEFPEVFERENSGFDAFVGNPPFLGGRRISLRISNQYLLWLKFNFGLKGATTDLCVYFLLQVSNLTAKSGFFGLILSDIISQGESRASGLEKLTQNKFEIFNCVASMSWPSKNAGVKVAIISVAKSIWLGEHKLNGKTVHSKINSYLEASDDDFVPKSLLLNENLYSSGHYLMDQCFVINQQKVNELILKQEKNQDVLLPYFRGDDINNHLKQFGDLFAINFGSLSLQDCEKKYPDCLEEIRKNSNKKRKNWWQFARPRPHLQDLIQGNNTVIVQPFTAKYILPTVVTANGVYAHPMVVISDSSYSRYAVLQSIIHEIWVWKYCSTSLDLLRYTTNTVLSTFPFPIKIFILEDIGKKYYENRQQIILENKISLTEFYNKLHDSRINDEKMRLFRLLHIRLNEKIVEAYGWDNFDLNFQFQVATFLPQQNISRFTISEPARLEILRRLSALNRERYLEEVEAGLHKTTSTKPKKAGKTKGKSTSQENMFASDDLPLESEDDS